MTVDERDAMNAQFEEALAIADQYDLFLTAARIVETIEALSSETANEQPRLNQIKSSERN